MSQVTVTLVFASIAEAAAALGGLGKSPATISVTPAASTPTAAAVQPPAAAQSPKAEPTAAKPQVVEQAPVDPSALATALQNFAKRDNAAFGALMKQHGLKNMAAVTEAKHLHTALMAAATNA